MAVAQEQKTLSLTLKRIAKVVKFCQIRVGGGTGAVRTVGIYIRVKR
jgi:hypothetical protein